MKSLITTLKAKWSEYIIELIVIIASIMIAFFLDNWNERRILKAHNRNILQNIYQTVESEAGDFKSSMEVLQNQFLAIDRILFDLDQVPKSEIPELLFSIGDNIIPTLNFTFASYDLANKLNEIQNCPACTYLTQELISYGRVVNSNVGNTEWIIQSEFSDLLNQLPISPPRYERFEKEISGIKPEALNSDESIDLVIALLKTEKYKSALEKHRKSRYSLLSQAGAFHSYAHHMLNRIKTEYPDIEVGVYSPPESTNQNHEWCLVGSGVASDKACFLVGENGIKGEVQLNDGKVILLMDKNSNYSGGGKLFPAGLIIFSEPDSIPVEAGLYTVEIEWEGFMMPYYFTKIEEDMKDQVDEKEEKQ
ncbi:MAG: hypothetical protein JXQ90_08465 [Cyclobacteriaceae bacterium]